MVGKKDKITVLLQAATHKIEHDQDVLHMATCLAEAWNLAKTKELLNALAAYLPGLYHDLLSRVTAAAAPNDVGDAHLRVLDLLKQQQDFCDVVGGKAKFQKQVRIITRCVEGTRKIATSLQHLADCADKDLLQTVAPAMDTALQAVEQRPPQLEEMEDFSLDDAPMYTVSWQAAVEKMLEYVSDNMFKARPCMERLSGQLKNHDLDVIMEEVGKCGPLAKRWHRGPRLACGLRHGQQ